jgi:hypothetical protein
MKPEADRGDHDQLPDHGAKAQANQPRKVDSKRRFRRRKERWRC